MELEPLVPEVQGWDTLETREFYTLREVGKILRMSKKHVYQRLIRRRVKVDGKVQYRTRLRYHQAGPGEEVLVRHRDLTAYVSSMAVEVDPEMEGKGA